eukprot:scaffold42115_cov31-Tisochrysis_lutea.AAC.3
MPRSESNPAWAASSSPSTLIIASTTPASTSSWVRDEADSIAWRTASEATAGVAVMLLDKSDMLSHALGMRGATSGSARERGVDAELVTEADADEAEKASEEAEVSGVGRLRSAASEL